MDFLDSGNRDYQLAEQHTVLHVIVIKYGVNIDEMYCRTEKESPDIRPILLVEW